MEYSTDKRYWYIDNYGIKQHCRWLLDLSDEQLALSRTGDKHLIADPSGTIVTVKKLYSMEELHPTMEEVHEHIAQFNFTGTEADLGFMSLYFFDTEQIGEMFFRACQFESVDKGNRFINKLRETVKN
jgi:hypothetical protein